MASNDAVETGHLWSERNREIAILLAKIACIIFVIEVFIMVALSMLGFIPAVFLHDILDATTLTLAATPLIYRWVARPFVDSTQAARARLTQQLIETRQLLQQNKELHQSLSRLNGMVAENNEHVLQRIGADIHDGPAQLLTFALLSIDRLGKPFERADDKKSLAELEKLRGVLGDALREMRNISTGLSLPELQAATLTEAIQLVVRRHREITGMKVVLNISDVPANETLAQKISAYRFVQEAMTNAFKHANATVVEVSVSGSDTLVISVRDDGTGFDPNAPSNNGLGLSGMQSRLQSLGGQMSVQSSRGEGTTATAIIKINA